MAWLAPTFHPAYRQVFAAATGGRPARVDVTPTGEVCWADGDTSRPWLSLSNVIYSTYRGQRLDLPPDVYECGGDVAAPYVVKEGDVCVLGGALASSRWGTVATVPSACRPRARLTFTVDNADWTARVDLLPDGKVQWVGGHGDRPWLSLGGICYSAVGGENLTLEGGWTNLGRG